METHPQFEAVMYDGSIFLNNRRSQGQTISSSRGVVSLYEANVDRNPDNLIYSFLVKDGTYRSFYGINNADYHSASLGETLIQAYPLTGTIDRQYINEVSAVPGADIQNLSDNLLDEYFTQRKRIVALRNTIESYRNYSDAFKYYRQNNSPDFMSGTVNLISIPSIMFDSGIKPGSVSLKFYHTGTLLDEAVDKYKNGELISTMNETSGSVVGVVLYNEGFALLTSSATIVQSVEDVYRFDGVARKANWTYFGAYISGAAQAPTGSLYSVSFKGTNVVPTRTMFAHADRGKLNNSQNPTWLLSSSINLSGTIFTSASYQENRFMQIKNTVDSEYCNSSGSFEKQVFISQIGIFDEFKRLIGIAKLANPVLKKETDDYTFKIKVDF